MDEVSSSSQCSDALVVVGGGGCGDKGTNTPYRSIRTLRSSCSGTGMPRNIPGEEGTALSGPREAEAVMEGGGCEKVMFFLEPELLLTTVWKALLPVVPLLMEAVVQATVRESRGEEEGRGEGGREGGERERGKRCEGKQRRGEEEGRGLGRGRSRSRSRGERKPDVCCADADVEW